MTVSVLAAVLSAAVLGMCFSPTRWLGIAATAFLTFCYPWLLALVLTLVVTLFYLLKLHK